MAVEIEVIAKTIALNKGMIRGLGVDAKKIMRVTDNQIFSLPPRGMCKIINIYFDPERNKMVVEYDNQRR